MVGIPCGNMQLVYFCKTGEFRENLSHQKNTKGKKERG